MNVQEDLLREKIDPWLIEENLSALATEALGVKTRCHDIAVLTGGCWNRVISTSIDGGATSLVFKISPKPGDADLQRECQAMQFFRAHTSLPVPEVYLVDLTGERVPGSVLVMEQVRGSTLEALNEGLNDEEREKVSTEIAEHVADLHMHQATGFGGLELPVQQRSPTWPDFWMLRFDQAVLEAQETRHDIDHLLAAIREMRDQLPLLLNIGVQGTLTHYDIWGGNVMVHFTAGRPYVSGFLDPFGYYADYAREISSMCGLGGLQFMEAYQQRHSLDETFEVRYDVYSLKMSLQMACMYPDTTWPVDRAKHYLTKIQAYLGEH